MRDYLATHYGSEFDNAFGKGTGKAIMHATAGRWAYLWIRIDRTVLFSLTLCPA